MNNSNLSREYKKIYELSKYSDITTEKMESKSIPKEYCIPIKGRNISGENQENEEENIEMQIKIGSEISSYRKGEYIDTNISENQWNEDRLLW